MAKRDTNPKRPRAIGSAIVVESLTATPAVLRELHCDILRLYMNVIGPCHGLVRYSSDEVVLKGLLESLNRVVILSNSVLARHELFYWFREAHDARTDAAKPAGNYPSFHDEAFHICDGFLRQVQLYDRPRDLPPGLIVVDTQPLKSPDLAAIVDVATSCQPSFRQDVKGIQTQLQLEAAVVANLCADYGRELTPRVDGPWPPFTWRLGGKVVDGRMQPKAWNMVNYLWQQQNHSSTFDDLKVPVYDDPEHIAEASTFGALRKAANKFFREHSIGWRVETKKTVVSLTPEE